MFDTCHSEQKCDQISDVVLYSRLVSDPKGKVACQINTIVGAVDTKTATSSSTFMWAGMAAKETGKRYHKDNSRESVPKGCHANKFGDVYWNTHSIGDWSSTAQAICTCKWLLIWHEIESNAYKYCCIFEKKYQIKY